MAWSRRGCTGRRVDHGVRAVSGSRRVVGLAAHACVIIDYDTGQTQLRPKPARLGGTIVHLDEVAPSWGTIDVPAVLPGQVPVPLRGQVPGRGVSVTFELMLVRGVVLRVRR